jgi:predicted dinucleotide-binding enzyme
MRKTRVRPLVFINAMIPVPGEIAGAAEFTWKGTWRTTTMKIAIIGAGNVGTPWAADGPRPDTRIVFGVRDPNEAKVQGVVRSVGGQARAETVRDAVASSEIVTLATPWPATKDALTAGGSLSGTILVDATNPLTPNLSGLVLGHTTSAAEQVAAWTPGAKVVKAFNTIGPSI